jgi:hypothetical protein
MIPQPVNSPTNSTTTNSPEPFPPSNPNGSAETSLSTGLGSSHLPPSYRSKARSKRWLWALLIVLGVTGVSSASYFAFRGITREPFNGQTHTVKYEPLQMTIVERGTLESAENGEIMCHVKAGARGGTIASTIKWVIDDGTRVKKDQPVIDLDDAGLLDQLADQKIKVETAEANMKTAKAELDIQLSQNVSDVETAKNTIKLAKLTLDKYVNGDFGVNKRELEGKIENSTSSWELWQDKAYWSLRMANRATSSIAVRPKPTGPASAPPRSPRTRPRKTSRSSRISRSRSTRPTWKASSLRPFAPKSAWSRRLKPGQCRSERT